MADSFWSWPASHVLPVFFCLLGAQLPMRGRLIYVSQSADNTGVRPPRVNVFDDSSMLMTGPASAESSSVTANVPPLVLRAVVSGAASAVPVHHQLISQLNQWFKRKRGSFRYSRRLSP